MRKLLGEIYYKFYAQPDKETGEKTTMTKVIITKLLIGALLAVILYETLAIGFIVAALLATPIAAVIGTGLNVAFPQLFRKSNIEIFIGFLLPLGLITWLLGKD